MLSFCLSWPLASSFPPPPSLLLQTQPNPAQTKPTPSIPQTSMVSTLISIIPLLLCRETLPRIKILYFLRKVPVKRNHYTQCPPNMGPNLTCTHM